MTTQPESTNTPDLSGNDITLKFYTTLTNAYAFFNEQLFDGKLPPCLIALARSRNVIGQFESMRGKARNRDEHVDLLTLNPDEFKGRSDARIISDLVHEMVHLFVFHFGQLVCFEEHNCSWADKMEAIGLMPSSTGKPGGKRTGEQMTHIIINGGLFDNACAELLSTGLTIDLQTIPHVRRGDGRGSI